MAKQKYYAIRVGRETGVFKTWYECELRVKGYKGAQYQSFSKYVDAQRYAEGIPITDIPVNQPSVTSKQYNINSSDTYQIKHDECVAYVDGSYNPDTDTCGYGILIIDNHNKSFNKSVTLPKSEYTKYRNVTGEIFGAIDAVKWACKHEFHKIIIYHDYLGISSWITKEWKCKSNISKMYVDTIKRLQNRYNLEIEFIKVDAHSGVVLNEFVDLLAKQAVK